MIGMAVAFAALAAFLFAPSVIPDSITGWRRIAAGALRLAFALVALFEVLATSIISIPADKVGIVRKIYGDSNLTSGHIVATQGETGYQAAVIPPGTFRISIFFNVLNQIDLAPVVVVPQGFYGHIVANDGEALGAGQIMADSWPDEDQQKFLDAEYFMTHGGQKGLQLSILKPGVYPLNLALFQVRIGYQKNGRDVVNSMTKSTICAAGRGELAARHLDHPRAGGVGRRRCAPRCRSRAPIATPAPRPPTMAGWRGTGDAELQGRVGDLAAAQRLLPQPRRL